MILYSYSFGRNIFNGVPKPKYWLRPHKQSIQNDHLFYNVGIATGAF